jgi:hypothetical protein
VATITFPNQTLNSPTVPTLPDGAKAITPSDTDVFDKAVTIYVGGAGTVTYTPANGAADVVVTMPAGSYVPSRALAVKATGTTATLLVAVF